MGNYGIMEIMVRTKYVVGRVCETLEVFLEPLYIKNQYGLAPLFDQSGIV